MTQEVNKVEVCVNNLHLGSQAVFDQVSSVRKDVRLRSFSCLGYCHRCVYVPFVLINDTEFIEGTDAEDLWEQVKQRLLHGQT